MKKKIFATLWFISVLFPSFSQSLSSHRYIAGLTEATSPVYHVDSDSIVFTYQAQDGRFQPRYVGIVFAHENFIPVYELQYFDSKDDAGNFLSRVYYIFLPIDEQIETLAEIQYRYIVDGSWIADPLNPSFVQKIGGGMISLMPMPAKRKIPSVSPLIDGDEDGHAKVVTFLYQADPGEEVFLAGSFNNWDPFMYPLTENPVIPGKYEIKIRLLPGRYQYNYYYRGRRVKDPLNAQSSYDIEGYEYSLFLVKS